MNWKDYITEDGEYRSAIQKYLNDWEKFLLQMVDEDWQKAMLELEPINIDKLEHDIQAYLAKEEGRKFDA